MKKAILFLLFAVLLASCSDMRYDMSEGRLNKDITLFEDEISVPIGSFGPFTVKSLLFGTTIGNMLADYISEDPEDGTLALEGESQLYAINVHTLEQEAEDASQPFTWKVEDASTGPGGMVSMLSLLGLKSLSQSIKVTAFNPLKTKVPVQGTVVVTCLNADYEPSFTSSQAISPSLAGRNDVPVSIYEMALPENVTDVVNKVSLDGLSFDLPANPTSKIHDDLVNDVFKFSLIHHCNIGVSEKFRLPQNVTLEKLGLNIGRFKVSKCEIAIEVENTLPLAVTINSIKVLKAGEGEGEWVEDENITVTPNLTIAGGSPEVPGVSKINLQIEAAEGTVPDIETIRVDVEATAQPGCSNVPLSSRQGLLIKSSSAKISGGITIAK